MKRFVIQAGLETVNVYEVQGTGDLNVLFLHGVGGSGKVWMRQMRELRTFGRLVAVDLPGFSNGIPPVEIATLSDLVPFLCRVLDTLGIEHAVWVGNSLGGRVALEMALTHSERVDGLGLLCSAGVRLPGSRVVGINALPKEEVEQRMFYQPEFFLALKTEDSRQASVAARALYARIAEATEQMDFCERLPEIGVPTRVIWGRHDGVLPLPIGQLIAERIPNAKLHVLEEAAHVPQMEQPQEVSQILRELLEEVADKR